MKTFELRPLREPWNRVVSLIATIILITLGIVAMIMTVGCTGPTMGRYGTPVSQHWRSTGIYGVGQSELPPDPIRRSETHISNLDGSYQYSHSQGTQTSVYPDGGWNQYTHNYTSESYTPRAWYPPMYWDSGGGGIYGGSSGGIYSGRSGGIYSGRSGGIYE